MLDLGTALEIEQFNFEGQVRAGGNIAHLFIAIAKLRRNLDLVLAAALHLLKRGGKTGNDFSKRKDGLLAFIKHRTVGQRAFIIDQRDIAPGRGQPLPSLDCLDLNRSRHRCPGNSASSQRKRRYADP